MPPAGYQRISDNSGCMFNVVTRVKVITTKLKILSC